MQRFIQAQETSYPTALAEVRAGYSGVSAREVLGRTDAMKMLSCMTLFNVVTPKDIFQQVIDKYYNGREDRRTLSIL